MTHPTTPGKTLCIRINLELTGQDKKLSTNTESDGRYHSNWLNMMYPRLKLARNLLTDDGVIFISIDDNEVANLRKICDEIFGEENFVDCLKWKRKKQPSFLAKHTAQVMEYILVYGKNAHFLEKLSIEGTSDSTKKVVNLTNQYSERIFPKGVLVKIGEEGVLPKGKYLIKSMSIEYMDDVAYRNGKTINEVRVNAQFSVSQEKINEYVLNELLFITANKGLRRDVGQDEIGKRKSITDLLLDWGDNQDSDNEIKSLFNKSYFDYTKPTKLLSNLVKSNFTEASIILDFFSGSATTAHAVMQLNAEDGGNRKYICVQLPEVTPEESEARKAGYTTIPEIAKERIRRAGKKILEEQKAKAEKEGNLFTEEEPNKLDTGFKVFKLDSSNINAWDSDPDNLETALNKSLFNIKEDRSEDDLLYEILIKYGIELTEKIKRHTIDGKTVYEMGAGSLIVCLADSLSTAVADGIGKLYKEVSPEGIDGNCRVVFKEAGFNGSDEVKTNTLLILKQHGITNVASV
ncbi:site-specific DNA-methyltransferase [uncultured Dysgonomonas sp.]|uniref:site-specific DNA-methyltransferase n=1 Tax=uncultured Dysgonomonas sp. TaxID=206096 RepID=UPI00260CF6CD|nr:site-specific DNA-methyltransferase [uncultured Dysgonomonas sp.]